MLFYFVVVLLLSSLVKCIVIETRNHTANSRDYSVISSKRIYFEAGQDYHIEDIYILGDFKIEDDEYLTVALRDPVEGILGDIREATITIFDDDSKFESNDNM